MRPLTTKAGYRFFLFAVFALLLVIMWYSGWFSRKPTRLETAASLIRAGKSAYALTILEDLETKQPDNASVLPLLAQAYLACDRLAEGRTALDTAFRLKMAPPELEKSVLAYVSYYESKNDFAEAGKLLSSAQAAFSAEALCDMKARLYLAWADYDIKNHHLADAIECLKKANQDVAGTQSPYRLTVCKRLSAAMREMASVYESKGNADDKACTLLKDALAVADEPQTRMALANIYAHDGKLDFAIENLRNVTAADPHNLEARHKLVELLVDQRNYAKAQPALLELTDKERSVENYELLAALDVKLGNYAGAVRAYEDATDLRPHDGKILNELNSVLLGWSNLLYRQGKLQESASVKGHAARVQDMLSDLERKHALILNAEDEASRTESELSQGELAALPLTLSASRIWLPKGSLTPEGEIVVKNIFSKPLTELSLQASFYDNTAHHRDGTVLLTVASANSLPLDPGASRTLYFSCPNIVKPDHRLAVIIFWRGKLLKELPVVKQH